AREDERGHVDAGGGHELAGGGLVAGGEADHAVEPGALDHRLDVGGEQVPAGQHIAAAAAAAHQEVGGGDGADLERHSPGGLDRALHLGGDRVEVAEAGGQPGRGVHHGDLRFG